MNCGEARRRGGGAQRSRVLQEPVELNALVSGRTLTPPDQCRARADSKVNAFITSTSAEIGVKKEV